MPRIGHQWLSQTYGVGPVHPFVLQSEFGRTGSTAICDGIRSEVYPESYRPASAFPDI